MTYVYDTEMLWVVEILPQGWQGPICLVHPNVRDKHRVSENDLSQPMHETVFGDVTMGRWRHNWPTQLSNLIIY